MNKVQAYALLQLIAELSFIIHQPDDEAPDVMNSQSGQHETVSVGNN